ncbi:MAG: hypothetical protein AB7P04_00380 [Bacteriovoracia bacterium]
MGFNKIASILILSAACGCTDGIPLHNLQQNSPGPALVCDPNGAPVTPQNGLVADLKYLTGQPPYDSVMDYQANGIPVPAILYFNQLFVPTRLFSAGFETTQGALLQNNGGEVLLEWFTLHYESELRLNAGDVAGDYQFALLSDDGAILRVDRGEGFQEVVNNDLTHPTRLGCPSIPVNMQPGESYPMDLDYFQGPRFHISLILLWRLAPNDAQYGNAADPACGVTGNEVWFDPAQSVGGSYQPKAAYTNLLARGWSPVPAANFYLPQGQTNPCAGQARAEQ